MESVGGQWARGRSVADESRRWLAAAMVEVDDDDEACSAPQLQSMRTIDVEGRCGAPGHGGAGCGGRWPQRSAAAATAVRGREPQRVGKGGGNI